MDLKPANVLISKNYITKLTDFGEAFNKTVCNKENYNYNPGRTLPYCPPEMISEKKKCL